jgi:hypothetical protein
MCEYQRYAMADAGALLLRESVSAASDATRENSKPVRHELPGSSQRVGHVEITQERSWGALP